MIPLILQLTLVLVMIQDLVKLDLQQILARRKTMTCHKGKPSFHRMDMLINFTNPMVASKFDANTCTWAFGMNLFDLHGWRQRNLIGLYHKYLHLIMKIDLLKLILLSGIMS